MKKYKPVSFQDVHIHNGFWHERQKINSDITIYSVWERFKDTGRFDAFTFSWKKGEPNPPHIFWESDFAKWAEAVAFILEKKKDERLEQAVDEIVDLIEEHQDANGYFNIWFTVGEPENRFKKRTEHELYCAGHLMEAAVAYFHATGKKKFLHLMCKYADYIETVFVKEKTAAFITPGHEEIELALVKLYQCTGEQRYLALSKFFINNRGKDDPSQYYNWANAKYAQDHLPVREQSTAEGHAVRATYLYSGMADIAYEYEEDTLFQACRKIFENIAYKKMYITGGIGSGVIGEAFTIDYDLPNLTAYTESCAAIGLILFARRMLLLDADSLYSDVAERALYNGFLSSISLDGKSFFYENPLEIDPRLHKRDASIGNGTTRFPIMQRLEVFDCSCCPPNIARFIASVGDLLYTYNENTVWIHHYIDSTARVDTGNKAVHITQSTEYPRNGSIQLTVSGAKDMQIAVRIPGWCNEYKINSNGAGCDFTLKKGYAYIQCTEDMMEVELDFEMKLQWMEASPYVQDNAGRVALQRGPVVYCLEAVDNGTQLRDVMVDGIHAAKVEYSESLHACTIEIDGYRRDANQFKSLYQPVSDTFVKQKLKFIPYYAFANRGESEMIVWVLKR